MEAFEAVESTKGIPAFSAAWASKMPPFGQSATLRPVSPIMKEPA
jgi:hypothetical protein